MLLLTASKDLPCVPCKYIERMNFPRFNLKCGLTSILNSAQPAWAVHNNNSYSDNALHPTSNLVSGQNRNDRSDSSYFTRPISEVLKTTKEC